MKAKIEETRKKIDELTYGLDEDDGDSTATRNQM